jgi:signal peptidase I
VIRCAIIEVFLPGGGFALRGDLRAAAVSVGVMVLLIASLLVSPFGVYAFMPVRLAAMLAAAWRGRRGPPAEGWRWRAMAVVGSIGLGSLVGARLVAVEPYRVPTVSMEPTITRGQMIVVDKLTIRWRAPARGEVVAFRIGDKTFVKRVIGLGGDRVAVRDGLLFVNGVANERRLVPQANPRVFVFEEQFAGRTFRVLGGDPAITGSLDVLDNYPVAGDCGVDRHGYGTKPAVFASDSTCVVPAGTVFVVGDNRINSADSRYWGAVPAAWVFGRVVGVD